MPEPLRILLVDDHPVVRHGLRAMFDARDDMAVTAEATDGQAALDTLTNTTIDIVLMDLHMPTGMDGVTATRHINTNGGPPVLVLTTYDSDADILAAVEAGATGYLLKDAPPDDLCQAVLQAAHRQTALAPGVAQRLWGQLRHPKPSLSPREIEILRLLAQGLSNRALSKKLFISEATVKTHLVHIYDKLDVDNRTAAITTALNRGIIRPQ